MNQLPQNSPEAIYEIFIKADLAFSYLPKASLLAAAEALKHAEFASQAKLVKAAQDVLAEWEDIGCTDRYALERLRAALTKPRIMTAEALGRMIEPLGDADQNQPGYQWKKGWNAALMRAMDYAAPISDKS